MFARSPTVYFKEDPETRELIAQFQIFMAQTYPSLWTDLPRMDAASSPSLLGRIIGAFTGLLVRSGRRQPFKVSGFCFQADQWALPLACVRPVKHVVGAHESGL